MPELGVHLGRLELKNPVVCGSSEATMTGDALRAAVDAGAAAVVAKSTNESEAAKRQLGAAEYLVLDERWNPVAGDARGRTHSVFNRSGLVAEPFESWVETVAAADAYANERGSYVVASLIPADLDELARMARAFEHAGVRWLELNLGASHGEEAAAGAIELVRDAERVDEVVSHVRAEVAMALTVKLPSDGELLDMVASAYRAGADSVCLAGRPLGFLPDPVTRRPLLGTFGAVGGYWALPLTLRWIAKARLRFGSDLPLVATNGVRDGLDVARALLAGASAVQVASVVWRDGFDSLTRVLDELAAYLEREGVSAADIVGEAVDTVMTYEEAGLRRDA
ncbi:MAG: dihydroorotate dehydrogenase [Actinobacteria bacterium]|nr:dihydroorotate dehydrogenase [Actinomycetota bacterium]